MQLDKPTLGDVVDGAKTRYQIPLYQRTYDWGTPQYEQLWADVLSLAVARRETKAKEHFLGTLVLDMGHQTPNENTFLVVDGQQRLTTLTMLLAALRDVYKESGSSRDNDTAEEIHEDRLVHRKKLSGPERFRLWPTQGDRAAYMEVIDGEVDRRSGSNIVQAYLYFVKAIHAAIKESEVELCELYDAILDGLRFVSITAEAQDNVYAIFESLNNTGLKLTQGDLLRNFYFSRLGDLAESTHESFWYPMQERLSRADLAHLFWLDMTWSNTEIKKDDTFKEQAARVSGLSPEGLRDEVKRFNHLSVLLEVMRRPSNETDSAVRRALQRLVDFGIESIDPLVLGLLSLRQQNRTDATQTADALAVIEAFLVRRLVVRAPHNALSRILMRAFGSIDESDPAGSLRDYLSRDNKDFATDDQIREAVVSVNFYRSGSRKQQKTLLMWLEGALAGNEPADLSRATVEHVLPQKLSDDWRGELSPDLGEFDSPEAVHETYVHTLANLTLSGYNSALSNKPFAEKRSLLVEKGNIELNKWIAGNGQWRRTQIIERGKLLSEQIITSWPGPISVAPVADSSARNTEEVADALQRVPAGKWVSFGDLANATQLTIAAVRDVVAKEDIQFGWRVMEADGRYFSDSASSASRDQLETDGVQFDAAGAAMQQHRWHFATNDSDAPVGTQSVASELHAGPIKDFLDEAANRLAPSVAEALRATTAELLARGGRVLLSIDAQEQDVFTAALHDVDVSEAFAEVRLTPFGGLWIRRDVSTEFELVDAKSVSALRLPVRAD
ncbi:DUF262 domain-containing protein [Demequina pelophila]|uniref:DUF262 domain-containing protein n=1 Tax=Demequina pelophila TaxID=1638984 RepID=UPI0007828CC3|nr:DUF262 domain-containing protein [Demequina pelophila]